MMHHCLYIASTPRLQLTKHASLVPLMPMATALYISLPCIRVWICLHSSDSDCLFLSYYRLFSKLFFPFQKQLQRYEIIPYLHKNILPNFLIFPFFTVETSLFSQYSLLKCERFVVYRHYFAQ